MRAPRTRAANARPINSGTYEVVVLVAQGRMTTCRRSLRGQLGLLRGSNQTKFREEHGFVVDVGKPVVPA